MSNNKINPNHLSVISTIKVLVNQFNIILNSIDNQDIKKLAFCKTKNVKTPHLDLSRNIYAKYIKCGNEIFYHVGFIFENNCIRSCLKLMKNCNMTKKM